MINASFLDVLLEEDDHPEQENELDGLEAAEQVANEAYGDGFESDQEAESLVPLSCLPLKEAVPTVGFRCQSRKELVWALATSAAAGSVPQVEAVLKEVMKADGSEGVRSLVDQVVRDPTGKPPPTSIISRIFSRDAPPTNAEVSEEVMLGHTALSAAVEGGHTPVVEVLLSYGSEPFRARHTQGRTWGGERAGAGQSPSTGVSRLSSFVGSPRQSSGSHSRSSSRLFRRRSSGTNSRRGDYSTPGSPSRPLSNYGGGLDRVQDEIAKQAHMRTQSRDQGNDMNSDNDDDNDDQDADLRDNLLARSCWDLPTLAVLLRPCELVADEQATPQEGDSVEAQADADAPAAAEDKGDDGSGNPFAPPPPSAAESSNQAPPPPPPPPTGAASQPTRCRWRQAQLEAGFRAFVDTFPVISRRLYEVNQQQQQDGNGATSTPASPKKASGRRWRGGKGAPMSSPFAAAARTQSFFDQSEQEELLYEITSLFLESGVQPDLACDSSSGKKRAHHPALHLAVSAGLFEVASLLLQAGADTSSITVVHIAKSGYLHALGCAAHKAAFSTRMGAGESGGGMGYDARKSAEGEGKQAAVRALMSYTQLLELFLYLQQDREEAERQEEQRLAAERASKSKASHLLGMDEPASAAQQPKAPSPSSSSHSSKTLRKRIGAVVSRVLHTPRHKTDKAGTGPAAPPPVHTTTAVPRPPTTPRDFVLPSWQEPREDGQEDDEEEESLEDLEDLEQPHHHGDPVEAPPAALNISAPTNVKREKHDYKAMIAQLGLDENDDDPATQELITKLKEKERQQQSQDTAQAESPLSAVGGSTIPEEVLGEIRRKASADAAAAATGADGSDAALVGAIGSENTQSKSPSSSSKNPFAFGGFASFASDDDAEDDKDGGNEAGDESKHDDSDDDDDDDDNNKKTGYDNSEDEEYDASGFGGDFELVPATKAEAPSADSKVGDDDAGNKDTAGSSSNDNAAAKNTKSDKNKNKNKNNPASLPDGWNVALDPSTKRPYYFNQQTGVTTWVHPLLAEKIGADPTAMQATGNDDDVTIKPSRPAHTREEERARKAVAVAETEPASSTPTSAVSTTLSTASTTSENSEVVSLHGSQGFTVLHQSLLLKQSPKKLFGKHVFQKRFFLLRRCKVTRAIELVYAKAKPLGVTVDESLVLGVISVPSIRSLEVKNATTFELGVQSVMRKQKGKKKASEMEQQGARSYSLRTYVRSDFTQWVTVLNALIKSHGGRGSGNNHEVAAGKASSIHSRHNSGAAVHMGSPASTAERNRRLLQQNAQRLREQQHKADDMQNMGQDMLGLATRLREREQRGRRR